MKHLKKIAAKLDDHGRNGDSIVAHLNPREAALLKALGGAGTINPKTGLLEFYDGSSYDSDSGRADGSNSGFDGPQGGGQIADLTPQDQQSLGFNPNDLSDTSPATISAFNPMYDEAAQAAQFTPRSMPQRAFDWARAQPREFVQDLKDKPFATLGNIGFNMVTGGIPAAVNTVSGWFNGPTVGGGLAAAGRGIGSAMGFSGAPATQVAEVEGKTAGAIDPSGDKPDPMSGGGDHYNPTQSGASGSGMSPLAQALAGYGITNDGWNNWGRRKTLGPLVSSYDPNGRQYVTPWDYRG